MGGSCEKRCWSGGCTLGPTAGLDPQVSATASERLPCPSTGAVTRFLWCRYEGPTGGAGKECLWEMLPPAWVWQQVGPVRGCQPLAPRVPARVSPERVLGQAQGWRPGPGRSPVPPPPPAPPAGQVGVAAPCAGSFVEGPSERWSQLGGARVARSLGKVSVDPAPPGCPFSVSPRWGPRPGCQGPAGPERPLQLTGPPHLRGGSWGTEGGELDEACPLTAGCPTGPEG